MREKDLRYLIFAIGFITSSFNFMLLSLGIEDITSNFLLYNIYNWTSLPIMIVFLIATNECCISIKKINSIFFIYCLITISTYIIAFIPLDLTGILLVIRLIIVVDILVISFFILYIKREGYSLIFLISMICFTVAIVSLPKNNEILSLFSYFMGFSLFGLVLYQTSNISKNNSGLSTYFSIKQKLQKINNSLYESEERFKQFFDKSTNLCYIISPKGDIIDINRYALYSLGYEKDELIGKSFISSIIAPSCSTKAKEWMDTHSSTNEEFIIITSDGKEKNVLSDMSDIKNPQGEQLYSILIQNDITDRIQYEETLEKNAKQQNQLNKKLININNELLQTKHEIETLNNELGQRIDARSTELAKTNERLRSENLKRKDAEKKLHNLNKKLKEHVEELEMMNIELNVTREQLATLNNDLELKVKDRTTEVEKLLEQKDQFISQLGHDLKTPLSPMIAILPFIRSEIEDKKTKEAMDVVLKSLDYMKDLVNKNLELARLNSPNITFDFQKIQLESLVNNVIERNRFIIDEKNISITNKINKNMLVIGDEIRLSELFTNLITNAVKYTKINQGIIIIDAKKDKKSALISVSDNGKGISKDEIDHIFDEFYKADMSRHYLDSSGLGLPICKRIVQKHGEKIWVESGGIGKGSTFLFNLKLFK